MKIQPEGELECLCSPAIWAEGPVWLPEENAVVFSDVKGNRMFHWSRKHGVRLWRAFSHYANGNARDQAGRVISCEHGRRGISRTEPDGEITLLVDKVDGKRFNSPNDVVVRSDGTIWFTDPPYGIISDDEGYKAESQVVLRGQCIDLYLSRVERAFLIIRYGVFACGVCVPGSFVF